MSDTIINLFNYLLVVCAVDIFIKDTHTYNRNWKPIAAKRLTELPWPVATVRHNNPTRDAEIASPGIAKPDNAAPYRKGGHRETCELER